MPAFTGNLCAAPIYAATSGMAGGAFDARTVTAWPYTTSYLAAGALIGSITAHLPLATAHSAFAGVLAPSFGLSDWYDRIHITPALIALGNLVSGLSRQVRVWNAWLNSTQTLDEIDAVADDGITLTGPGALPLTFAPNQELIWTAAISTQGSPVIAAQYTFVFSDGEAVVLLITGQRITAWALSPDWSATVRETFAFKTDVLPMWSAVEQRRALRIAPRRTFDFAVQMNGQERRFVEAQLFAWSARVWALPIWPDGQFLTTEATAGASTVACDTVDRDFVANGLAILVASPLIYEVLNVATVTPTAITLSNPLQSAWVSGARLYPVRAARLVSYPKLTRANGVFAQAQPTFLIIDACDWPAATGLPMYRGAPVLETRPAEGSLEMTYGRQAVTIDGETGVIAVDDRAGIGLPNSTHDWFMQGRAARSAFRSLLYRLMGRQGEMWVPTFQSDLRLVADVAVAQGSIDVEMTGYTLYLAGELNRKDIRFELYDGTVIYRRITGSVVFDPDTERLTLDTAMAQIIHVSEVRRISYMVRSRLDSDSIELQHHTAIDGLATAVTPWRALNHDV